MFIKKIMRSLITYHITHPQILVYCYHTRIDDYKAKPLETPMTITKWEYETTAQNKLRKSVRPTFSIFSVLLLSTKHSSLMFINHRILRNSVVTIMDTVFKLWLL